MQNNNQEEVTASKTEEQLKEQAVPDAESSNSASAHSAKLPKEAEQPKNAPMSGKVLQKMLAKSINDKFRTFEGLALQFDANLEKEEIEQIKQFNINLRRKRSVLRQEYEPSASSSDSDSDNVK